MPRYFFDVTEDGVTDADEVGVVYADREIARAEALRLASEIAAEASGKEQDLVIRVRLDGDGEALSVRLILIAE
jgi:hypothetical protein